MNLPPSNPRYELIAEAANTVKTELSLFADEYVSDDDSDGDDDNKNKQFNPADLEMEVHFLRTTLEYFYAYRVFPFSNADATQNFISNYLPMADAEYTIRNQRMRNRYKMRVWRVCKRFETLEVPREQDAFELGNRVWGGMSLEMIRLNAEEDHGGDTSDSAEEDEKKKEGGVGGKGKEAAGAGADDDDDDEFGLRKYPQLKKAFNFKNGIIKMPVVSKKLVEKGLVAFGEEKVKAWEEKWKRLEVIELKNFLAKVNLIRNCAITVMDQLQAGADQTKNFNQGADQGR